MLFRYAALIKMFFVYCIFWPRVRITKCIQGSWQLFRCMLFYHLIPILFSYCTQSPLHFLAFMEQFFFFLHVKVWIFWEGSNLHLFLTLLSNIKRKWKIDSNFSGLLRISELYETLDKSKSVHIEQNGNFFSLLSFTIEVT